MHCACCQGFGAWPGPCQQCLFLQGAWPLYNHKKIMQRNVFLLKRPPHATQSFSEQRFALASGFAEIFLRISKRVAYRKGKQHRDPRPQSLKKKQKQKPTSGSHVWSPAVAFLAFLLSLYPQSFLAPVSPCTHATLWLQYPWRENVILWKHFPILFNNSSPFFLE